MEAAAEREGDEMIKGSMTAKGGEYRLQLLGHATGSPQVCAAVSGIVYALAGWLNNDSVHQTRPPGITLESGLSEITAYGDSYVETAFELAEVGLLQIAKQYPEYLCVKRMPPVQI